MTKDDEYFHGKRAIDQIERDGSIKAVVVSVMTDLISFMFT